jgi:predicted kinase
MFAVDSELLALQPRHILTAWSEPEVMDERNLPDLRELAMARAGVPDWSRLCEALPRLRKLERCLLDAEAYGANNAACHTQGVLSWLVSSPGWAALPGPERPAVFLAALLLNLGRLRAERSAGNPRAVARGHVHHSAIEARLALWEIGLEPALREQVCALIELHRVPLLLGERADAQRRVISLSVRTRCDQLALVAEAELRRRPGPEQVRLLDNIDIFQELCADWEVADRPWVFPSEHDRFLFFRDNERHPDARSVDSTRGELVLMCGLPASGKDHWIRNHLNGAPVIEPYRATEERNTDTEELYSPLLRAQRLLQKGERVVWNAPNLDRDRRAFIVQGAHDVGARVRIVYTEVSIRDLWFNNRSREHRFTEAAMCELLERWQVPDATEAHRVEWAKPSRYH